MVEVSYTTKYGNITPEPADFFVLPVTMTQITHPMDIKSSSDSGIQ